MNILAQNGKTHAQETGPAALEHIVRSLLGAIGEHPDRPGLHRTPERVARMYAELTAGYHTAPDDLVNGALFDAEDADMVVVTDIEFFSLCEHHMLPFFGRAHVAYVPRERVIGLSKIPRIVDLYARRLQIQERLTRQVAAAIEGILDPLGVGVVIHGRHLCSMMRGVKKPDAGMVTSAMRGCLKTDWHLRQEFLAHIQRS